MRCVAALLAIGSSACGRLGFDVDGDIGVNGELDVDECAQVPALLDGDGDGWGGQSVGDQCAPPPGTTSRAGDCNDADPLVHPEAVDACTRDRDCDGALSVQVPAGCATIQEVLDAAVALNVPATVTLAAGTHIEDLRFRTAAAVVIGGGPGVTTLRGTGTRPVVVFVNSSSVAQGLSGMTVTGGVCEVAGMSCYGGGIRVDRAAPVLTNLEITGNQATQPMYGYGGGLALIASNARLADVEIHDNTSNYYGGGAVHFSNDASTLERVRIVRNDGTDYGGGVASYFSSPRYENVILTANHASYGGALFLQGGAPALKQLTMVGNTCMEGCAVGVISNATVSLASSTCTGNQPTMGAGAIELEAGSTIAIAFSNFFSNGASPFLGLPNPTGSNGNIAVSPQFVSASGSDPRAWQLRLGPTSPLRNAGDPSVQDLDASRADIGAFGGPRSWP